MKRMKRRKRTRWPHWAKALRNLLIALALLTAVRDVMGMSLPVEMEFRRLERKALAPPSEIIAVLPTRDSFRPHILIGCTEDWAMVGCPYPISSSLSNSNIYPLTDGPNLICLRNSVGLPDEAGQTISHAAYAALRPPEGSANAVLTLHNEDGDFTAEGIREGKIFLFYFRSEDMETNNHLRSPIKYTYEMEFFDKDKALIQKVSG